MAREDTRSTMELISDAFGDASALLSSEAKLLRAEMNEKINQALSAMALMLGAAIFFIGALLLLLEAGVAYLVQMGFSTAIASLIMFGVSAVMGLILFFIGKSALAPENLKPDRAMNQINRDMAMARQVASGR